jgi:hypothetical protein
MNCLLVGVEKKCTWTIPIQCRKGLTRIFAFIGVSLATTKCGLPFGGSIRRMFPMAPRASANKAVASFGATAPAASPRWPRSAAPSQLSDHLADVAETIVPLGCCFRFVGAHPEERGAFDPHPKTFARSPMRFAPAISRRD